MATFSVLRDGVYTLTNRPDLVSETTAALRKALVKFHTANTWKQDITRVSLDLLDFPEVDTFRWQVPLSEFPNHRRPKALRLPPQRLPGQWPTSGNALFRHPFNWIPIAGTFEHITVDNIFDSYNIEKPNYFYVAGDSLYIKGTFSHDALDYFYYRYPTFSSTEAVDNITSWIADQFPDAIIEEAASAVFKAIGKDDEASTHRMLFAENMQLLTMTDTGEN